MAKASPIQTNFTAGELSPRLDGRTDVAKYDNGCKTLENMLVHPQGGATRRPGTKFIGEVQDSSKDHRLIPFEFNVDQTYAVEFGDNQARFVTNDGFLVETKQVYDTDALPSVGFGVVDSSVSDVRIIWDDDGENVFFYKTTEEKTGSTHTLEIVVRQYETVGFSLFGAKLKAEKTFNLPDRYSSNVPEGERRFHCGIGFIDGNRPADKHFYVWDGIPDADITAQSTSHTDCNIWVDYNTGYDISGVDEDLTAATWFNYELGASQTTNRYPIPISGLAFTPHFKSVIPGQEYNESTQSWASSKFYRMNDYNNIDNVVVHLQDDDGEHGRLHVIVSNLIEAGQTVNSIVTAGGYLIHINTWNSSSGGPDFSKDCFTEFPYSNVTNDNYTFSEDPFEDLITDPGFITGLQVVAGNNYWLADANGNYAHTADFVDAGSGYNTDGTRYISSQDPSLLDLPRHMQNPSYMFITTHLSEDGKRVALVTGTMTFSYFSGTNNTSAWVFGPIAGSDDTTFKTVQYAAFALSELEDLASPSATSDWGCIGSWMQADGKRMWFNDGSVSSTVSNVATSIPLKYPYHVLKIEESVIPSGASGLEVDFYAGTDTIPGGSGSYTWGFDFENAVLQSSNPLAIPTPFSESQLSGLRYAQSADVLFLAHPDVPPQDLVRYGATLFSCQPTVFTRGPMQDVVFDGTTLTASGRSGSVTITASDGVFRTTDVDRLVKLHDGYAKITAFTSGTSVTATVIENEDGRTELMPSYTATTISAVEGDPSGTGLSHNDRFEDSAGNFIERGFKEGMRISVTGFTSHANNNEVGALIVSVTDDTILIAPAGDLTTEAAGDSVTIVGDLEADDEYRLGAFSETSGYPSVITLYEQRLILGNTLEQPQTLFFSSAGLFTDFTPGIDATDAITYTLSSNQVNVIQYLVGARLLVVGTSGGEFSVSSGGTNEPLTPTNVQIRRQSNYGGSDVQPFAIGSAVLFVQRAERKLRELVYDFDTDSYFAPDLTLLSEHLTEGLIKEIAWQQEPDGILWARLADGSLIGLTYRREEEVIAWHRHDVGGSGFVESLISLPSRTGEDELYMIVKRTINSVTKRYIERLSEIDNISSVTDPKFLDSHLTYSGAAVSSLSGLDHLEGETVSILANGAKHADKTVSSGSISLDVNATNVVVGYKYSSTLETMRIDAGGTEGTSQGKTKRIRGVTARFLETSGAQIGPDTSNLKPIAFAEPGASATTAIPLYNGDKYIEFSGNYETDGFIVVKQDDPLPMTVLALMPLLQTFDR